MGKIFNVAGLRVQALRQADELAASMPAERYYDFIVSAERLL